MGPVLLFIFPFHHSRVPAMNNSTQRGTGSAARPFKCTDCSKSFTRQVSALPTRSAPRPFKHKQENLKRHVHTRKLPVFFMCPVGYFELEFLAVFQQNLTCFQIIKALTPEAFNVPSATHFLHAGTNASYSHKKQH